MSTSHRLSGMAAFLAVTLAGILVAGCGGEQKLEPVAVGELTEYHDIAQNWHIMYPKEWIKNAQTGQARFYNAPEVDQKFKAPGEPGVVGVEIAVDVIPSEQPAADIKKFKEELVANLIQFKPDEAVTIAGLQATRMAYVANYGAKNIMYGHYVMIPADSVYYRLSFAGFGPLYDAHAAVFDAVLKTFSPMKPKEKGADETLPSTTFADYSGKMFSFQYPENFNFTSPAKGKYEEVVEIRGVRQDCSIRLDISDAKGLTLEKVFEQSKGLLRGGAAGKATVGGEPAMTLAGAVSKDVQRKFYLVVRNGKIIRITTDWYRPQQDAYAAAYDKVISSIRFK